ncbi:MAG: hypothetical protein L0220_22325 [Acidobacteria bacterium]|nr:hypothetical protein [Acidobacteriota bacterium]
MENIVSFLGKRYEEFKAFLLKIGPNDHFVVEITPELADSILKADAKNRVVRKSNLERIKREMLEGRWSLAKSEPIRFLRDGRLADGQHRLRAVVDTGIPLVTLVYLIDDTFGINEGAARTLADYLILSEGVPEEKASVMARVTRAITPTPMISPTLREMVDFYRKEKEFIAESVAAAESLLEGVVLPQYKVDKLAIIRAKAIRFANEKPKEVDLLLTDAVNNGQSAPEGSARRDNAHNFNELALKALSGKKLSLNDLYFAFLKAMDHIRHERVRDLLVKVRRPRKSRAVAA